MNILHLVGSMNPRIGGPGQYIRHHAPELIRRGNHLEVLCLDHPDADYLAGEEFEVHALGPGHGAWNYHPGLLPWLQTFLPGYDTVILDGLWQYQSWALWKATQHPASPPNYIFPQGMLAPRLQNLNLRPFKAMRNWCLWKAIQHRVVQRAAGLLFTSEAERRLARQPFRPYCPRREDVVGLGIPKPPPYHPDMKAAFLEKCPALNDSPFLLFLGHIHPNKGIDLLIKAYAAVCLWANTRPVPKLVIAGPEAPAFYGRQMRALAEEFGVSHSIFWPGMLTGAAKLGALYLCDASVLPSHQENSSNSVVETLACGRPVLLSNQVNLWREIQAAGAGLVQPDTEVGTIRLLQDWIQLPGHRKEAMNLAAQQCFRNRFTVEKCTGNLLSVIATRKPRHLAEPVLA